MPEHESAPDPIELQEPRRETHKQLTTNVNMGRRFLYVMMIWVMLGVAATVLTVATVVQFITMLTNRGQPNERLADFGEGLGIWIAKAARFQAAASETKPWPWTDID